MAKLTWEGPKSPVDGTVSLIDSGGNSVERGGTGNFSDEDAALYSVHHVLTGAKGEAVEPQAAKPDLQNDQ